MVAKSEHRWRPSTSWQHRSMLASFARSLVFVNIKFAADCEPLFCTKRLYKRRSRNINTVSKQRLHKNKHGNWLLIHKCKLRARLRSDAWTAQTLRAPAMQTLNSHEACASDSVKPTRVSPPSLIA